MARPKHIARDFGAGVTPPSMDHKNYWISWLAEDLEKTEPKHWPPDLRIVGVWCSGYVDNKPIMVAWVVAKTEASAKAAMLIEFPETKGITWRFFEQKENGFRPGARFPIRQDWAKLRAKGAP